MCKLQLRGKFYNSSFICVHVPTEDKDEEEKDNFYDELEKAYDECPTCWTFEYLEGQIWTQTIIW
jgi:hypothetical protein